MACPQRRPLPVRQGFLTFVVGPSLVDGTLLAVTALTRDTVFPEGAAPATGNSCPGRGAMGGRTVLVPTPETSYIPAAAAP